MPEILECPSCGRKLKVPDALLGKTVRCTDCAGTFTAEKPSAAPPPPPPPAQEEYDDRGDERDEEYDDRPSRRRSRRRSRRGDYDSHRGGMVMAFGIISVVAIFVTAGAFFAVGPFAGLGDILGLIFGIMAWVMGSRDMKEINARRMDPEGRGMTQAGYIMGVIGSILHGLAILCSCVLFIIGLAFVAAVLQGKPPPGAPPGPPPRRFEAPPPARLEMQAPLRLQDYLPR